MEHLVKTPRTPEGAERRALQTFDKAIEKYTEEMELDDKGHVYSNTIDDKEEGIKISIVPCYDEEGLARKGLALMDVEEYSNTRDQKHRNPTAKTTYLFDDKGQICEMCYCDTRKFQENQNPYYEIYEDKDLNKNLFDAFEEINTPINATLLDSIVLSNSLYDYDVDVITDDIEKIAYPAVLKTYMHSRLENYVDGREIEDSLKGLKTKDLREVAQKVAELDDDELQIMAEEAENNDYDL